MRNSRRVLVLLHPDGALQRRVTRAAEEHFEIQKAAGWREAAAALRGLGWRGVLLVDPFLGSRRGEPSQELRRLLAELPSAAVVAVLPGGPTATLSAHTLGLWGVCQILDSELERTPESLRDRLQRARGRSLRGLLLRGVHVRTTPRGRALLEAALEVAPSGGGPGELAAHLGVSRPTLLRRCRAARLPPPRRLLQWLRLLTAAEMLDDPGRRVMDVAIACGYSTDASLRRGMRRLAGASPVQLRARGAFDTVARAFLRELNRDPEKSQRR
jgi:AraC-like DNA-binding protein